MLTKIVMQSNKQASKHACMCWRWINIYSYIIWMNYCQNVECFRVDNNGASFDTFTLIIHYYWISSKVRQIGKRQINIEIGLLTLPLSIQFYVHFFFTALYSQSHEYVHESIIVNRCVQISHISINYIFHFHFIRHIVTKPPKCLLMSIDLQNANDIYLYLLHYYHLFMV